ncbi:HAMP domain-containing sensor histidine kinase [Rhodococcus sp. IEGM 1379]|uniref:sensor histidine kinase n=1 Tax=Rhodococcus sp. IEGM 1379 TaxID=3047086 RepID=UPI0024B66A50|nr:HAMP domain-containing sensor histidine kinase [Rhodococcus sp. IEGM 1379]MDI9913859.1 HAMP domain-containing sensor histidine kinase [Rhodococcus sp. IEGM 1379]
MICRRKVKGHPGSTTGFGDEARLRRAGRSAAIQAAVALGAVLLIVGAASYFGYARAQDRQIRSALTEVAATADDADDPPPGMSLAFRSADGAVAVSPRAPRGITGLLDSPVGYTDFSSAAQNYRALVSDGTEGRVVVVTALEPYETGRQRLLLALGFAEITGIAASVGVVFLLSRRAIRPLSQALELQRRFVADASHELRAPLTVLHTRAQLLARRGNSIESFELVAQLNGLVDDTRALGEVIEDLLMAASMDDRRQSRHRVDMAAVCEQVRGSVADHAQKSGVSVETSESGTGEPVVLGIESALRRAVLALVDNALAHERQGGHVLLHVERDRDQVKVRVSDTGIGIAPEVVPILFDRFSHGEMQPAGSRRYGIGLSLVREIAHAHRGEVIVESTPGVGSAFELVLPAAG